MGGKTGTTTSSVSIPPEVLARYNAVNKTAQDTAAHPFQEYSSDPSAFVAGINNQQQTGIADISKYANYATPILNDVQAGYSPEGYAAGVKGYMNPYLEGAVGATAAQMNNLNQQEQQKMIGSAIGQGAFGGDRANIGLGNLENQQNLAFGQTISGMENQGYQQAAQNYMAGQQNRGNLAIQGQQAGIAGGQAELGAGTLEQQTSQAGLSALYNQFQQKQAYPFQVAQFLANIAEGTGALSGSSTTTTGPQSWFSDARLKEDIKQVGTAKNGLPIYKFKYKGDPAEQTHVGYMAQDVEKVHPEAVGESHGFKTVDYEKASQPIHRAFGGLNINPAAGMMEGGGGGSSSDPEWAKKHPGVLPPVNSNAGEHDHPAGGFSANHDYSPSTGYGGGIEGALGNIGSAIGKVGGEVTGDTGVGGKEGQAMYAHGGVIPNHEGGVVGPQHASEGYFNGGDVVNPNDLSALLAAQQQMYAPFEKGGIYGNSPASTPGGNGVVPAANLHVSQLGIASPARTQQGETVMGDLQQATNAADTIKKAGQYGKDIMGTKATPAVAATANSPAIPAKDATGWEWFKDQLSKPDGSAHGGVVGYASGGDVEPYQTDDPMSQAVSDTEKDKNKHSLMTAQNPTGQNSSTLGDLSKIAAIPGEISGLGSAASAIGSGISTALPFLLAPFGLATGGVAEREHHARGEAVGDGDSLDSKMQYSIAPQNLADMDPVQQQVVKSIYGPESSNKYNVLNGGETFDNSGSHPHRIGKGGESTAAGAGQFIGETWDRVTGGAPMTPGYQDAATWKLATDDYKRRTGRDLHEDVAKNGFSPEVKSALAPTWTSLGEQKAQPSGGVVAGSNGAPAQAPQSIGDFLSQKAQDPDIWLSALSGLGAMAGSNSRYLGSAILQGIGGAADTYRGLQSQKSQIGLQQSEILKNTMGMVNTRFQPLLGGKFLDSTTNQTIDAAERARRIMSMGIPPQMAAMIAGSTTPTDTTTAQGGTEQPKSAGVVPPAGAPAPEGAPTGKDLGSVTAATGEPPKVVSTTEEPSKVAAQPAATTTGEPVTKTADQGDILAPSTGLYAKIDQLPDVAKAKSEYTSLMSQADEQSKMARAVIDDPRSQAPAFAGALRTAQDQMASANQLRANAASQLENWRSLRAGYAKLPEEKLAQMQAYMGQPHEVTSSDGVKYQIPGDILYPLLSTADENGMITLPNGRKVYTTMPLAMAEEQKIKGTPQTVYDQYGQSRVIPGDQYLAGIKSSNGTGVFVTPDGETVSTGADPFAKTKVTNYEDQYTGSNNVIKTWPTLRTKIGELSHIYQNFQANRATPLWADLNSWMVGMGMKPVDPKASAGFDAAIKSAMDQAITSTQEFAHNAPATGGNMAMQASADPIRDPDALYKNLTDRLGFGDYEYKRATDFMQQHPKDVGTWNADFNEKNKPQTFLDAAHREVKGFAGGSPEGSKAAGMPVEKGPESEANVVTVPADASQKTIFDLAKKTPINQRLLLPDGSYIWGQKK